MGGVSIPSKGKWLIITNIRQYSSNATTFMKYALSNTSSSSNIFTQYRMGTENVNGGASMINLPHTLTWLIEAPGGASINLISYKQGSTGTMGNVQDSNGRSTLQCIKLADTTYTGGIKRIGDRHMDII